MQGTKLDALTRRHDYHPLKKGSSLTTAANPQNFQTLLHPGQYLGAATTGLNQLEISLPIKSLLKTGLEADESAKPFLDKADHPSETHPYI